MSLPPDAMSSVDGLLHGLSDVERSRLGDMFKDPAMVAEMVAYMDSLRDPAVRAENEVRGPGGACGCVDV
jgi:hypothetical protein